MLLYRRGKSFMRVLKNWQRIMAPSRVITRRLWHTRLIFGSILIFFSLLLISLTRIPHPHSKESNHLPTENHLKVGAKPDDNTQLTPKPQTETSNLPEQQIVTPTTIKISAFANHLLSFDWSGFAATTNRSDDLNQRTTEQVREIETRQEELLTLVTPYLEMEPLVPVNGSCTLPPLIPTSDLKCQGHGNVFTGQLRGNSTPKIGILVQFGFGVDVLEIYLNEVYDVVDRFFIVESTRAHFRSIKKGLLWERVKYQPRFKKFNEKIVHLVVDDAETAKARKVFQTFIKKDKKFAMEGVQETLRWSKFLEWNVAHEFFGQNDLVGFGDSDEIPSREMLHMIRHCQINVPRFDMGIWFSYGNINYAFRTDWAVPGNKYTLGDPTFWTVEAATIYGQTTEPPTRMRGMTGKYLLGGMHMTYDGYLPFQIARRISCSECWPFLPSEISYIVRNLRNGKLRKVELTLAKVPSDIASRNVKITTVEEKMKDVAILPWFYSCNKNRYPTWEGKHDTRLD